MKNKPWLIPAAFTLLLTAAAVDARAQEDYAVDGYLKDGRGDCLVLTDHDGEVYSLVGDTYGLESSDHVRLVGHNARNNNGCPGKTLTVTEVQAIWGDDRHKSVYYDHLQNGPFHRWVDRNRR